MEDLSYYSFNAMTTVGSVDDFRYFLPRLFQGVTQEDYSYCDEILFGKLESAKWMTWPHAEIAAVKAYLEALWRQGLMSFPLEDALPSFFEIETILASIAVTGEPLEPYLRIWTETTSEAADEHLIQFVTMFGVQFGLEGSFQTGFWKRYSQQADILHNWLRRPDTLRRISNKAHLLKSDGFEHLFAPALEALQRTT